MRRASCTFARLCAVGGRYCSTSAEGQNAPVVIPKAFPQPTASPYRKVGNVFVISCNDFPFKYSWEISSMLRALKIEFRGQVVIHPDIPAVRTQLWRVRHIVTIEMIDIDALKERLGVPSHVTFRDLKRQLPPVVGDEGFGIGSPFMRTKVEFSKYRQMRLRDIMRRDEQELKLLAERKKLKSLHEGN